jgi:hypothetical protein
LEHLLSAAAPVLLLSLVLCAPAQAASTPQRVKSAVSVVSVWSESQHLYVKGDVGVSEEQLAELEVWLTRSAPHWTVVLLDSAGGERFVDAEGTAFEDIEAVKHALGKGLPNRTRFGALKHPRTEEQDGAIFLLSLSDRNLSYFGSMAHDTRGLGEAQWKGQLDGPAIAAMRNGGRILDAVRDTILHIDARLERAISAEQEAREARRASLRAALQAMPGEVDTLVKQRQELFSNTPPPGVPQANPDVAGLRARMASALKLLDAKRPRLEEAQSAYDALRAELNGVLQGFAAHREALARLAKVEAGLETLETHPLRAFLTAEREAARETVGQARASVLAVAPRHAALLEAAESQLHQGRKLLEEVAQGEQRLAELARQLEVLEQGPRAGLVQPQLVPGREALRKARESFERQERSFLEPLRQGQASYEAALQRIAEAERSEQRRRAGGATGGSALLVALGVARFRRNARRREALALYSQWRTAMDEKMQSLFGLLDRTHLAAGRSREEVEKRYAGLTRERGLKLTSDVDELFLLSVGASRVLGEAEGLLNGKGGLDGLGAHLTTARYERVTRLLRDEPITFHPDEGIELVLRGPRAEEQRLIGDRASYQPFSLSFESLVQGFNTRAAGVLAAVEQLEAAPSRARETVAGLERLVAELRTAEAEAPALRAPALAGQVASSLEARVERARPLLPEDPLAALEGPLVEAVRQESDTRALLAVLARGRSEVLPVAERAGEALVSAGLSRRWLEESIESLARQGNEVARELVEKPAVGSVQSLADALARVHQRAAEAEALVGMAGRARAGLTQGGEEVARARAELGQALDKAPSELLCEEDANPSERAAEGEALLAGGREALGRGELESARQGLEGALERVAQVEALVKGSREAHARFVSRREACLAEAQRLMARVSECKKEVGGVTRHYLASALRLRAGDPEHPNANGTVQDNLAEADSHMKQAAALLEEAGAAFAGARLLASAELLRQVEAHQALVSHRAEELLEKVRQLRALEERNMETLKATELLASACATAVADARTMRTTLTAHGQAKRLLQEAHAAVEALPGDPFQAAELLSHATLTLTQVQQAAEADRGVHAHAGDSLQSARATFEKAQELAQRAAKDGIADSTATAQARKSVEALGRALQVASTALGMPHGDWNALETEAEQLEARAGRDAATLRGELEAAERAVASIQRAASVVQRTSGWSSRHGVSISGRPGALPLTQARTALSQGRYGEAEQSASTAEAQAREALEEAERQERWRREAEEERREAERRRDEESARRRREAEEARYEASQPRRTSSFFSSASSSSGSGFSSSSWSRGSSSRGGGSSSGSGFGSSSW